MLFQYSALFNSVTVGENVALPLREYTDLPEGAIQAIVRLKLSLVGLPGIENRMPSELSGGMRFSIPGRPTSESLRRTIAWIAPSGRSVYSRSGSATFSPTVTELKSAEYWKSMPIDFRTRARSSPSRRAMSCPPISILPPRGRRSPIMCLRSVVFPEPEPPRIARISPRRTAKSSPKRTCCCS